MQEYTPYTPIEANLTNNLDSELTEAKEDIDYVYYVIDNNSLEVFLKLTPLNSDELENVEDGLITIINVSNHSVIYVDGLESTLQPWD